ncbi:MAG: EAL domain-containing protein [Burkholderiaceae bacterium]|nr:EAL domain-containing protein [Burkholderiaceae bacterium]
MTRDTKKFERPTAGAPLGAMPAADFSLAPAQAGIVVLDDEPLNSAALVEFLHGAGYRRVSSLSGPAVTTHALREELPDLVLLELGSSQPDAFELMRLMHADSLLRRVPVIVLTAQHDRASRLRALELGAADFLVKPVDAAELDLRLRNTLAAKAYRDQLAHTDTLTGLPNRESLLWRLDWALRQSRRHGTVGVVMQIGLDRFRQVNDALGPAVGDELLLAVSQRLVAGLRDSDTVARAQVALGSTLLSRGIGDEFTVLLPVVERAQDAAVVARRLIERMSTLFEVAGQELFVSCRVGMAVFPGDGTDGNTVLRHAGVAMRHARSVGPMTSAGYRFYGEELNAKSLHHLRLERELHHALERGEFRLYYQAQVDVASGRLCGAEALVRWQHPQRGLVGPGEFISVAEEAGLIARLGDWVLREALRQLAAWRHEGLLLPQVAVKSAIIDSGPQVTETLNRIKQLGVQLSLDDFGTGFSSLTHLRRFPLDEIKVDRSFVTECDSDRNNSAITAAIIAMAHRLGLRVVAEGVETPRQLEFLRAHGADAFQGFLYAQPLPAAEFAALLAPGPRSVPAGVAPACLQGL